MAHVAGYDDEHRLEKAPILEIDPIPELQNRNDNPGLERLQVKPYCPHHPPSIFSDIPLMFSFLLFLLNSFK